MLLCNVQMKEGSRSTVSFAFPIAAGISEAMVMKSFRRWLTVHRRSERVSTYVDVVKGQSGLPWSSNPVTRAGDVWTLPAKASDAVDRVLLLAVAAP